jgi:hypothetical protein
MYERRRDKMLSTAEFARRVAVTILMAAGCTAIALLIGIIGYHFAGRMTWLDALLNASMILGGMGPVSEPKTSAAKVFASAYALFSGLVFIGLLGVVLSPFAHRMIHHFHMEDDDDRES